jgi:hypothetical protein
VNGSKLKADQNGLPVADAIEEFSKSRASESASAGASGVMPCAGAPARHEELIGAWPTGAALFLDSDSRAPRSILQF